MQFLEVLSNRRGNKEVARVIPTRWGRAFHFEDDQTLGMDCPEGVLVSPSLEELKTKQCTRKPYLIGSYFNGVWANDLQKSFPTHTSLEICVTGGVVCWVGFFN